MATSSLKALLNLLSTQIDVLEALHSKSGVSSLSVDEPFVPTLLDRDPAALQATQLAVAAASQILATVRSPVESIQEAATSVHMTTILGFIDAIHVVDILFEGGPQVAHLVTYPSIC
jgi:hypothetical protein